MNNKKGIIALLLVVIVGIVGLTISYFSNEATITNEFQSNDYGTIVEEVFESPDNWTPGTTTNKTITVTNAGNVDEAVRISYIEKWELENHNEISGWVDASGNLSAHTNNEETDARAALINWANTSDWIVSVENGTEYRYYKNKLSSNETTSSLIESVTFNPLVKNLSDCETSNSGKTITCLSTGTGYDGAKYTLTFNVETVQYDKYKQIWSTNVNIVESSNTSNNSGNSDNPSDPENPGSPTGPEEPVDPENPINPDDPIDDGL